MAIMLTIVNCNRSGGSSLRVLTAACANRGSKTQLTAQFTKFQEKIMRLCRRTELQVAVAEGLNSCLKKDYDTDNCEWILFLNYEAWKRKMNESFTTVNVVCRKNNDALFGIYLTWKWNTTWWNTEIIIYLLRLYIFKYYILAVH